MNLWWKGLRRRLIRRRCLEIRLRRRTISCFMCFHRELYDGHSVCSNRFLVRGNKMLAPLAFETRSRCCCQHIMLGNASAMSSRWLRTVYEIIKIAGSENKYFHNSRRVSDVHEKLRDDRLVGGFQKLRRLEALLESQKQSRCVHLWWIDPLRCFRINLRTSKCFQFMLGKCFYLSPCKNLFWIAKKKLYFAHFASPAWTISAFRSWCSFWRDGKCLYNRAPLKMKTKPGNSIHIVAVTFIHKTFLFKNQQRMFFVATFQMRIKTSST